MYLIVDLIGEASLQGVLYKQRVRSMSPLQTVQFLAMQWGEQSVKQTDLLIKDAFCQ